jgi:hypothetical protein
MPGAMARRQVRFEQIAWATDPQRVSPRRRSPGDTWSYDQGTCPWPKLDLKGVDHTTAPSKTAADKESQKCAGLREERSVNGSPV